MTLSRKILLPMVLSLATSTAYCQSSRLTYMQEVDAQKRVILAAQDGSQPQVLPSTDAWALYPDLSSDGRYVAFSAGSDETHLGIMTYDLSRKVFQQWTEKSGLNLHADFSGDGNWLAFSGPVGENGKQSIALVDLAKERTKGPAAVVGGREIYHPTLKIIPSANLLYFPTLSSSGAFLVYQATAGKAKYLVKRDIASGEEVNLTPVDGYAMSPALSFDNRYVAFTERDKDGVWDLFQLDMQTNTKIQLTKTPFQDFSPAYRPDGSIVYAANPNDHFQLFELTHSEIAAGSLHPKALPEQEGDLYSPSISGDDGFTQAVWPHIPAPGRSSFGAIAHQGKIFIVGGHVGPEHTYPPQSFSNRVDIFDEATKTWAQGAPLSLARHGFSLAAHNGFVYAFGGFTYAAEYKPQWKSVDLIERYSIAENKWEIVGHLAKPRSSNVVATVGDRVYLVGGWDSTPQKENDAEGRFHDTIEMFDMSNETVTTLDTTLVKPLRRALSAVVRGNEVILVGGLGVGANHFDLLDQVTALNVDTLAWKEYPKLPFATFAPAAGILNDELFVFGGMFKTGNLDFEYVDHVYAIKLANDQAWHHTGRHLAESKGFSQVVDLNAGGLGLLGGHTYRGDEDSPVDTFETWTRKK